MSQTVLLIKLLLVVYTTQSQTDIQANCNANVSMMCSDGKIDSTKFISVAWYKFTNQKKNGIIRRGLGERSTQQYNLTRPAKFGENHSLFLPGVTPEDSGDYECTISANIGGQNLNQRVTLMVHACVTQADLTTMTNVLNTTQDSGPLCSTHVEDLPVMWSIIVYVGVSLTKIILSLISIRVIQAIRVRSSRRHQHKW